MKIDGHELNTVQFDATIDATPDGSYALRILRVYRQDCEVRWADTTSGEPVSNPMLLALNEMQEQRAGELDKAIALLERPGR